MRERIRAPSVVSHLVLRASFQVGTSGGRASSATKNLVPNRKRPNSFPPPNPAAWAGERKAPPSAPPAGLPSLAKWNKVAKRYPYLSRKLSSSAQKGAPPTLSPQSILLSDRLEVPLMSDRPSYRGGRGYSSRGGGGGGGGRGGGRGGSGRGGDASNDNKTERPKKENILDLAKYMDKEITVKFNGGREVTGTLKGYDALMNLVLDEVKETVRGSSIPLYPFLSSHIQNIQQSLVYKLSGDRKRGKVRRARLANASGIHPWPKTKMQMKKETTRRGRWAW